MFLELMKSMNISEGALETLNLANQQLFLLLELLNDASDFTQIANNQLKA